MATPIRDGPMCNPIEGMRASVRRRASIVCCLDLLHPIAANTSVLSIVKCNRMTRRNVCQCLIKSPTRPLASDWLTRAMAVSSHSLGAWVRGAANFLVAPCRRFSTRLESLWRA